MNSFPDLQLVLILTLTFLLAGCVKGVIGLGLPTVSLGLLTIAIDLPSAMALLVAPSLITNAWQALTGGNGLKVLRRIWPFLLTATLAVGIGSHALSRVDLALLSALLGALLLIYASIGLAGFRMKIRPHQEGWAGPVTGTVNGILTGMTGSFVVPGVMYLQAINLPRDALIQAMGMLFTLSTVALAFALQRTNLWTMELGIASTFSIVPAVFGMWLGQQLRTRLSEAVFRRVFYLSLAVLGLVITMVALR